MTQQTNFSTRLDDLHKRVATARADVRTAAAESDAQLKKRIDRAQARWTPRSPTPQTRSPKTDW